MLTSILICWPGVGSGTLVSPTLSAVRHASDNGNMVIRVLLWMFLQPCQRMLKARFSILQPDWHLIVI
jgi:hypothetical protein